MIKDSFSCVQDLIIVLNLYIQTVYSSKKFHDVKLKRHSSIWPIQWITSLCDEYSSKLVKGQRWRINSGK